MIKKMYRPVLICIIAALLFPVTATGKKTTVLIAVSYFANNTKEEFQKPFVLGLTDRLIMELVRKKKYLVVERSRMDAVFKEHELAMTGAVKDDDAIKAGKFLKAPFVVLPAVNVLSVVKGKNHYTVTVEMSARVVDTETGTAIAAVKAKKSERSIRPPSKRYWSSEQKLDKEYQKAFSEAVKELAGEMSEGKVLKRLGVDD